jgi:hypothetical protein
MSDQDPTPEITQLTEEQVNRLVTADWLESVAKLIRSGAATGFDIAWDARYPKPLGNVVMSTEQLYGATEMKLLSARYAAKQQELATKIPVQDISDDIGDHKCDSEQCLVCRNRKNEQKS